MKEIKLATFINKINGKISEIEKIEEKEYIKGISTDTREEMEGKAYIALRGKNFDGHNFVKQAIDKGALVVVVDRDVDLDIDLKKVIRVRDTLRALMDIAGYYRTLFKVKVVGITGSVGKTTTKDMISSVLEKKFKVLKTQENLNNEIGVSKTLLSLKDEHEVMVIEMGMCNFGEISELSKMVKPSIGVVTNIGVSHMETLKNQENIFKAKMEIIDGMEKGSTLILNGDDNFLKNYKNQAYNIKKYSINNQKDSVFVKNLRNVNSKSQFNIIDGSKNIKIKMPGLGEHMVYNALAAYLVGKSLELNDEQILDGIKTYKPSGMRQKIINLKNITIVEDCYNASPDSMKAAIKTLEQMQCEGIKIMVISDMLELGNIEKKAHYDMGVRIAKNKKINKIFAFGSLSNYYIKGALDAGMDLKNVNFFKNKDDLYESLKNDLMKNNIVWFKASRGMHLEDISKKIYNNIMEL